MSRRWLYGLMVLSLSMCGSVQAEMSKDLSISSRYDNNTFGTANGVGDYITQLSGSMSWWRGGDRSQTQFYYAGDGYLFASLGSRSFAVNRAGLSYVRQLGSHSDLFYAGSAIVTRFGKSDYSVYNYVGVKNYATLKKYLFPSVLLRTGYTMQFRNYWNMTTQRFMDHYVFAQVSKFWPTRTTLRGDVSYGLKQHGNSEGQAVLGLQVAQSLGTNTGLRLRYQRRVNTHANLSAIDFLMQDEDLLNDRYDYSGHEWTARLTQQLPDRLRLIVEGGYEMRNYRSLTTATICGLSLDLDDWRKDRSPFASVMIEKPFGDLLQARLQYGFEGNRSTDEYYDYNESHSISFDLEIGF